LLMGIATRLYNVQKDDVVLSQSLQALIELILLCFTHLDNDTCTTSYLIHTTQLTLLLSLSQTLLAHGSR